MKRISLDKIINLLMFFYILSIYLFTYRETLNMITNSLALLLVFTIWSNILLNKQKIVFNKFLFIYLLFILTSMISSFYAINQDIAITKVITLLLMYLIMLSLVNYINTFDKLVKLLSYFVYSGFFTSIYILLTSDIKHLSTMGSEIGNVNAIGMMIGISTVFCFYIILENKNKKKVIWTIFLFTNLFVILLTGSRKSFIFILLTFLIILFIRNKQSIRERFKSILFSGLTLIGSIYLVFNVSFFYEIIGQRLEGLIGFATMGDEGGDSSVNIRAHMITQGFEWFKEQPLIGYGINNYRFLYGRIGGNDFSYSHNNLIELLVGVGIIGTFLFYFSHLIVMKNLYKISQKNKYEMYTLRICIISIIFVYLLLSTGLVYYDNKHFNIVLVIGSIIPRLIFLKSKKPYQDSI